MPSASLTLLGPDTICAGSVDSFRVDFSDGAPPYTFFYSLNGFPQTPVTTDSGSYTFSTPILSVGTIVVRLDSVLANGMPGTVSGEYTITILPLPIASIPTDTIALCDGQVDTLQVSLSGPGPYTFVYAVNNDTMPPVMTSDTIYKIPLMPDPGLTVYSLIQVSGGICTGFVQGKFGVWAGNTPTATLSGDTTICVGETVPLLINFTGTPPFVVQYSANGMPQIPDTAFFNPRIIPVSPDTSTIYELISVSSNSCVGTVSGQATVNTLPALSATISGGGQICQGGAGAMITVTFDGTGPYTFVYSVKTGGQPPVNQPPVTTSSNPYTFPVNPPIGTIYQLVSVNNGTCSGAVSGVAVVAVFTPSTASLSEDLTFCSSADTSLMVDFTGSGPFSLIYTIDGDTQTVVETFDDPFFIPVNITTTTTYQLISVESPGCFGMVTDNIDATVTINYPPTFANVLFNCDFGAGTYTVEFDVLGATLPLSLLSGNGTFSGTHFTSDPIPEALGYSFIFRDDNDCGDIEVSGMSTCNCSTDAGTMNLTPVNACVNTAANPLHNGDQALDADDVLLYILHTAPDLPVGQILAWSPTPGFSFSPGMLTNTTYYISAVAGNPGPAGQVDLTDPCISISPGTPVIFYPLPTAVFDSIGPVCFGDTASITVLFTGAGPFNFSYSVNGIPEPPVANINQSTYVLQVPVLGMVELVLETVSDTHCSDSKTDTLAIVVDPTQAGSMNLTPVEGCTGSSITVQHNGDETLGAGDDLVYILHTLPGNALGTVLDVQNQPVFNFNPASMSAEITYYISAVAGNSDGNGGVDLSDPCLSVSAGTPVLWHQPPSASMDAGFHICPGETVLIPVTFTGQAPFTFEYANNGQMNSVVAVQNNFSISATLLQSAVFQAVSVQDAHCPGTASGQAVVQVHPAPTIANINVSCAPDNLTYVLEFDVLNADPATLMASGPISGSFDPATGHFTSNPVPAQTGFSITVSDAWQCGKDSISGGANCACVTSAGILDQTPLHLCASDTAHLAPATGFFLAPDDSLLYALVTSPGPANWTILALRNSPDFEFIPGITMPGVKYYIIGLAGNKTPNGIDMDDVCLSYALGPEVIWNPEPVAVLGSDTGICTGDTAALSILLSGAVGPFDLVYQANGIDQPVISTSGTSYLLSVAPVATTTYSLASVMAAGCAGAVLGNAVVTVHPRPQILNAATTCDLATETYTLRFSISNGAAPNPAYLVNGVAGTLTDSVFVSAPIPSGQVYVVTVSTPDGCTASATGTAICACLTEAGSLSPAGPLSICLPDKAVLQSNNDAVLEAGDVLKYVLYQNPAVLPQGILATNNSPVFDFLPGLQTEQTYYIAAMAGDSLPGGAVDLQDPCLAFSPGIPVVFHNRPTATVAGDTTVCRGSNVKFKIDFTGKSPFQFVYAINGNPQAAIAAPQSVFSVTTNNVQQAQTFTLISVQDAYCPGTVSGSYEVNIQAAPSGSVLSNTTICPGSEATLTLQLSGADTFTVQIGGGASPIQLQQVQNGAVFTVMPTTTTTYTITNLVATGNNCPFTTGTGAIVTVAPALTAGSTLSDYGGFNVSCPGETDGAITLAPGGGTPPFLAAWSHGQTGLAIKDLAAGLYYVTLTDNIGCQYRDSFLLTSSPGLEVDLATQSPKCFGERNGAIIVNKVQGGMGPYAVAVNSNPAQIFDVFPAVLSNLAAGNYQVVVADVNGCENSISASIDAPLVITVDLGADTSIFFGDSILITPVLSTSVIDTFAWSPQAGLGNPALLSTSAKPPQTTVYKLWVRDTAGCQAADDIRINVRSNKRVYIPNAFRPGIDGENGVFTVYSGPEVQIIRSCRVYDRWGECVYEGLNLTPNQPAQGWTGRWRDKDIPPGVYLYVVELEYFDGNTEIKSGDVTVLR